MLYILKTKQLLFNFKQPPKQLSNTRVDLENGVAYKSKSLYKCLKVLHKVLQNFQSLSENTWQTTLTVQCLKLHCTGVWKKVF